MEEYRVVTTDEHFLTNIKLGKYFQLINKKHKKKYGEEVANNTLERVKNIFIDSQKQLNDSAKRNNLLLVGKVQSGKTSNLEMLSAIAFDNGYNLLIIYGGYDNTLLSQTTERFRKIFEIESIEDEDKPLLLSTEKGREKDLNSLNNSIFEDLIEVGRPIIITSLKRPNALNKIIKVLKRLDSSKIKACIIDDEGDQASLNTAKNKATNRSATYAKIVEMKKVLNDPIYYSVTATPHANIFLDDISELRPETARLIEPGPGYCGGEVYHLANSSIIEPIDPDDSDQFDNSRMPFSLKQSLKHFILGSCIIKKRGGNKTDMIIHSYRNRDPHKFIYQLVNDYIDSIKIELDDDDTREIRLKELKEAYYYFFDEKITNKITFEDIKKLLLDVVKKIEVILKNTDGGKTQGLLEIKRHKIYIGGDLLQRGVTFENLITTYYTRWAQSGGNMDTNLQRARWFGYREKYIDVCKIFTTKEISEQFSILTDIEMDLWEQFSDVQIGNMNLEEMIISAPDNNKMRPTRANVASINKLYFSKHWMKQRLGDFDRNSIKHNNDIIGKFIADYNWMDTSIGRTDDNKSASYIEITCESFKKLLYNIRNIFEHKPFDMQYLSSILNDEEKVNIILMKDKNGIGRERRFYSDNIINNIHQGPDKGKVSERTYNGDRSVIINKNMINVQIHKILPKKEKIKKPEYTQYMFAIYIPRSKQYFVKGEGY